MTSADPHDTRKPRRSAAERGTSHPKGAVFAAASAHDTVRFLCRCGKLIRDRDVDAVAERRCPACGASFDEPDEAALAHQAKGEKARSETVRIVTSNRPAFDFSGVEAEFDPTAPKVESLAIERLSRAAKAAQNFLQAGESGAVAASPVNVPSAAPVAEASTRDLVVADVDRAIVQKSRPSYWRLIGPRAGQSRFALDFRASAPSVPLLLKIGAANTLLTVLAVGVTAMMLNEQGTESLLAVPIVCFAIIILTMGYAGFRVSGSLRAAARGVPDREHAISSISASDALSYAAWWTIAFASGPLWLFAAAYWYWLRCGTLTLVDWLVLIELWCLASAYWYVAVLGIELDSGLRGVRPWRVLGLVNQLDVAFLWFALVAGVSIAIPSALAGLSVSFLVANRWLGLACVVLAWTFGLSLAAAVAPMLGRSYRAAVERQRP